METKDLKIGAYVTLIIAIILNLIGFAIKSEFIVFLGLGMLFLPILLMVAILNDKK